jgi:hypothetical protein
MIVLVIFLLALLLGIIYDLQMSLLFKVNIFMLISSKTEPQKMILLIFVFSVSRHERKFIVSAGTLGQCYDFCHRIQ